MGAFKFIRSLCGGEKRRRKSASCSGGWHGRKRTSASSAFSDLTQQSYKNREESHDTGTELCGAHRTQRPHPILMGTQTGFSPEGLEEDAELLRTAQSKHRNQDLQGNKHQFRCSSGARLSQEGRNIVHQGMCSAHEGLGQTASSHCSSFWDL